MVIRSLLGLPSFLAVFLLLLAPATLAETDADVPAVGERQLQEDEALPSGVRIKNAPNKSIELLVLPSWDIFLGFSDSRKIVEGRLTTIAVYENSAYQFVTEPYALIDVENFGDGTKRHMATITVDNPMTGIESGSTSTVYVGEFAQAASPNFDMKCFPFDRKEVVFRITLQKPGNLIFALSLGCVSGVSGNTTVNGKAIGSYVGFEWSSFVCTQMDDELIACSIDGIREWAAIFNSYMWPSAIFTMMGFLAFTMDIKMSMPRVATTMLALVSLTNLRNSVVATLPTSGNMSWLEEYFLVSKTFMFLNLAGHAISFYLDATGRKELQRLANRINLWGMIQVMWLIVFARLHARNCNLLDSTGTGVMVALLSISTGVFFLYTLMAHRRPLKETFLPTTNPVVPTTGAPRLFLEVKDGKGPEDD
ncbi:unnamed protein product [Cladocopium goreaui]|uniref:Uncharacterized protein n=1 Tax=Cladocopium goreaui TaxID=2562237 RepID=A0A9P1D7A1_9DINO|nr:unnamed protein product [Cladocopium goreaui]